MPLHLRETDEHLAQLCREFERRVASVADLDQLELPVVLKATFQDEPEARESRVIATDQASYRHSLKSVFINNSTFWLLPEDQRLGVVAHEVGHAVSDRDALRSRSPFRMLSDCQVADLLACRWGFYDALRHERASYYGQPYGDALALWQDEKAYASAMTQWYQQRLAGLV